MDFEIGSRWALPGTGSFSCGPCLPTGSPVFGNFGHREAIGPVHEYGPTIGTQFIQNVMEQRVTFFGWKISSATGWSSAVWWDMMTSGRAISRFLFCTPGTTGYGRYPWGRVRVRRRDELALLKAVFTKWTMVSSKMRRASCVSPPDFWIKAKIEVLIFVLW